MQMFIVPLCALIFTQIVKGVVHGLRAQFSWRDFFSPGGMPSSHAAMTVSLCAMAGYFDGVDSVGFAISVILIVLVLWDAGVLRQIIGKHAGEINRLSHLLPQEEGAAREFLQERIGHRFPEILVGVVVGLFVSAIYILFLA